MLGPRYDCALGYIADGMRVQKVDDISLQWVENPNMEDGSGWYDQITSTNKPTWRYFHDGQMPMEDDHKLWVNGSGTNHSVTRYGLGARGIDVLEKVTGSTTTTGYPVYDGHGNMVATMIRQSNGTVSLADSQFYDAWGPVNSGSTPGDHLRHFPMEWGHDTR